MGINWMNRDEMAEAIPPVYTLWIGMLLLDVCTSRRELASDTA